VKSISEILPGLTPMKVAEPEPAPFTLSAPERKPAKRRSAPKASGLTPRQLRLMNSPAVTDPADSILYQHTVFCQTGLPYRDPGDEVLIWERSNGHVHMRLEAGPVRHPEGNWVHIGLPHGPKSRLILAHLNAEALRTQSPEIVTAETLTGFVRRMQLDPKGRNVNSVKDQLARLAATQIHVAAALVGDAMQQLNTTIVGEFDLWFQKTDGQRVLWPTTVRLSAKYFESLQRHAVPLNEAALLALSHSSMALDIYSWLAQRLHRITPGKPIFVRWVSLQGQFGWNYEQLRMFRRVFLGALKQVHTQYLAAKFEVSYGGVTLYHSAPPVPTKIAIALPG
jgi:hypothetical protein